MIHNFGASLAVGKKGEAWLHAKFPSWTRLNGRKHDFVTPGGIRIECKFETRTSSATPNLAMEIQSKPGKPGAIQAALENGCKFIIYIMADEAVFAYNVSALLAYLLMEGHNCKRHIIPNKDYNTTIALVPRSTIKHLEVPFEQFINI